MLTHPTYIYPVFHSFIYPYCGASGVGRGVRAAVRMWKSRSKLPLPHRMKQMRCDSFDGSFGTRNTVRRLNQP